MAPSTTPADVAPPESVHHRRRRGVHRPTRRQAQRVVVAVAVASAVLATFTDGAATGVEALDAAYRAAYGGIVALVAPRARRWTWFVLAGAATAGAGLAPLPVVLGVMGLALSYVSVIQGRHQRELGALVGALSAQALLRLPTDVAFGVPSVVAGLAPLPLALSGLLNVRHRSRYRWAIAAVIVALAVVSGAFVAAMLRVVDRATAGVEDAREGLAAVQAGDDDAAQRAFAAAEDALATAEDTAHAWWVAPARVVPVLAQHVEAVDEVAGEGRAVAALTAEQFAALDVSGLSDPEGGFDLEEVAALAPRADTLAGALERALDAVGQARSPWLVDSAADRIEAFGTEVAAAVPAARNASDTLAMAPELLGAAGPRTYVVLVGNPAESRELGGFVAGIGVLRADAGDLEFTAAESVTSVNAAVAASGLDAPADLPPPLPASGPERFAQNWTNTVDFPTTAAVAAQLGPALAGASVDGVLYLDPHAVAGLLQLTGPVPIEGRPEPLGAGEAVDFFLRDQYATPIFDDAGRRKELLADAAEAAFDRLTSGEIPDPRRFAEVLDSAVDARRLLFTTTAVGPHPVLERLGLRPPAVAGSSDQITVAQENLRANKLDAYLQRSVRYEVAVDDDGNATGTLTVALTNTAPTEGLDDYVTGDGGFTDTVTPLPETLNRTSVDVYTAFEVLDVAVDGVRAPSGRAPVGPLHRTAVRVDVPAGETVTVRLTLGGHVDPGTYDLALVPVGTAGVDTVEAEIDLAGRRLVLEPRPHDRVLRLGAPDLAG